MVSEWLGRDRGISTELTSVPALQYEEKLVQSDLQNSLEVSLWPNTGAVHIPVESQPPECLLQSSLGGQAVGGLPHSGKSPTGLRGHQDPDTLASHLHSLHHPSAPHGGFDLDPWVIQLTLLSPPPSAPHFQETSWSPSGHHPGEGR